MLVGSVVEDYLGSHAEPPPVGFSQELPEVTERPVGRVNAHIVRDVITIIPER